MAGKPSAAHEAAKRQFDEAPADAKPTARQLARAHGLEETTIHRAKWFIEYKKAKARTK